MADGAVHEDTDADLQRALLRLEDLPRPRMVLPISQRWGWTQSDTWRARYPGGTLEFYADSDETYQLAVVVELLTGCWGRSLDMARPTEPSAGCNSNNVSWLGHWGRRCDGASAPPDSCRTAEGRCDGSCERMVGEWVDYGCWECDCCPGYRWESDRCPGCGALRPPLIEEPGEPGRTAFDHVMLRDLLRARTAHLRYEASNGHR